MKTGIDMHSSGNWMTSWGMCEGLLEFRGQGALQ